MISKWKILNRLHPTDSEIFKSNQRNQNKVKDSKLNKNKLI